MYLSSIRSLYHFSPLTKSLNKGLNVCVWVGMATSTTCHVVLPPSPVTTTTSKRKNFRTVRSHTQGKARCLFFAHDVVARASRGYITTCILTTCIHTYVGTTTCTRILTTCTHNSTTCTHNSTCTTTCVHVYSLHVQLN